jgi:NADH dehydrogenase
MKRIPDDKRPRVVIVGAGFAGLWAARALAHRPVDVLLLDRNNFHMFLPLLYQVAAAELESEDVAYPVRSILQSFPNVEFAMSEVKGIDPVARTVRTAEDRIPFDFLVLASGSATHFFGVSGAAERSFPLKTLPEAIALRNHILRSFERAARETDRDRRRSLLTFVIVGGGATGVEYGGALVELIRGPLRKDFPSLDFREVKVLVIEARDGLLPGLPGALRAYARKRMVQKGVEVRLGTTVSGVTGGGVLLEDGSFLPTETIVWTTGVRGESPDEGWGVPVPADGRVRVAPTLQVPGHPEVYAVGDLAYLEQDGKPLPMMAPVAIQMGKAAAENIARQVAGLAPLPFRYRDPGTMVILGRNAAVAHLRGRGYTGFFAWVLWLAVHIYQLIGFRNRLVVMINWAWDYFFYERAVRIILPGPRPEAEVRADEAPAPDRRRKAHGGRG